MPTRYLWLGNMDMTLTQADLLRIFSPIGLIESLRLLPDKECAFINFHRVEDAVRAREEVMVRMGGRIGSCIVRVGFGKADLGRPTQVSPAPGMGWDWATGGLRPDTSENNVVMQPTRALCK